MAAAVGGSNDINRAMRNWGMKNTYMENWLPDLNGTNYTTPREMATMLYNIDNPSFLNLKSRERIIDYMSNVKNSYLIKAGLPQNAQFVHKTGDIGTMLGDAGIVYMPSGHKYIVVIMVERPWNAYAAKEFIIKASRTIYNTIANGEL